MVGVIILVLFFLVVFYESQASKNQAELLNKEIEIEKEKKIREFEDIDFYELVSLRNGAKVQCKKLVNKYGDKAYENQNFIDWCSSYRAYSELALSKWDESEHGPWFDYYDEEDF